MKEKHFTMGFGLSVTANDKAMNHFARMSEAERQEVLKQARDVKSIEEMEQLIKNLSEKERFY